MSHFAEILKGAAKERNKIGFTLGEEKEEPKENINPFEIKGDVGYYLLKLYKEGVKEGKLFMEYTIFSDLQVVVVDRVNEQVIGTPQVCFFQSVYSFRKFLNCAYPIQRGFYLKVEKPNGS